MAEGQVLIKDLLEATEVDDSAYLPIDDGELTKKISVENFNMSSNVTAKAYAEAAAASAQTASDTVANINLKVDQAQGYANAAQTQAGYASTYADNAQTYAGNAQGYANTASGHATNAGASASAASGSADAAADNALLAQSWAEGNTGAREGENTNNARYWANKAQSAAQITIDDHLDPQSTNPVENRVIYNALNDMHTGGSNIEITTTQTSLYGKDVTISDGTTTVTETFDLTGKALFEGVLMTGDLTITSSDGTSTATGTLTVPYFGNYTKAIAFWQATIAVTTTTTQFNGLTVSAKKNGAVVATATFSNGSATITVPEQGTYTLEVTLDWKTYTSSPFSVTEETTYNETIDGFIAPISLNTPTSEFYGQSIEVTRNGVAVPVSLAFSNSGTASFTALDEGTYLFTLTYGGEPYTASVVVSAETTYSAVIKMWTATINITTASSQLQSQDIDVYKGSAKVATIAFNASGQASYLAHESGTYHFVCTVDGYPFTSADVVVSDETVYSTSITYFGATLNISTSSSDLYSQTITIKKGSTVVGTTAFSAQGSASYTVHETGTYTCECEGYSGSAAVSAETTYNVTINNANVTLNVTASAADGTTLTATNGTDTETATISNGKAEFNLSAGDWEVAGIPITVVSGQTYEEDVYVFAVHYSETDSNPDSADYPTGYDNYGWTPFAMDLSSGVPSYGGWDPAGTNADKLKFFYPKSCMLKYNGERDYYLDEDDESKKEDGVTASDYNNTSYGGNVMMEWGQDGKRLYWKITADTNNDGWTFVVANAEVLGLKPWNHYDVNGDENEHWYTPKYFGSSDGTRMRSISGQSNYANNTAASEISLAEANNQTNDKIWTTETFCDYMFIGLLCALISKSLNSQAKFGAGRSASGNTSAIGQGTMNGKGQFYGKSNGTYGVKIFGMENFFGNLWRRVRGLININGSYRIKMTYDQTDGSTTDGYNLDGTGYINAGSIGTTAAWVYPEHDIVRDNCILAQTNGGSETTYYCDATNLAASGTFYAFLGGSWNNTGRVGVFCVHLGHAASDANTSAGAALSCKPLAE